MGFKHRQFIYPAILALSLSACGGGGGGGDAGISYTGLTTQASVTIANGEEVSATAYQNGGTGQGLGGVFSSMTEVDSSGQIQTPKAATLLKTLVGAVNKISFSNNTGTNHLATQSVSDSYAGECGGTASFSITVDDVSGDFSGSFTFSDYCELGDVMNGGISFSGNINPSTYEFGALSMTFSSLSISSGSDSFTTDGTMSFDPSSSPIVATMNMKLRDDTTQEVFWVRNFELTILDMISYEELSMDGRIYHPEYGYVDITTPTPLRYTGTNEYPYPGVMVATGSNGSTATLTSLSTTSYQIDIDEDGDSVIDQTTTGNWNAL